MRCVSDLRASNTDELYENYRDKSVVMLGIISRFSRTTNIPKYIFLLNKGVHYVQGQSPEPKIREYFYYIDHQGMLFLDDSRMKNFTSCFKDKAFLLFFFKRVKKNDTGRYEDFPFISLCGRERNFIRYDDTPIVFTQIIQGHIKPKSRGRKTSGDAKESTTVQINSQTPLSINTVEEDIGVAADEYHLSCNYTGEDLCVPLQPEKVFVSNTEGRVYHPASPEVGGVGLIKSSLAFLFSERFRFDHGVDKRPTHIMWGGTLQKINYKWIEDTTIPLK